MQNEKCEFAHSSFFSYSPLICSIPICATHLMTTESMGVLLYFYRVNSFRSQIHPTPIFITKRIVGHITWGIVNSLPKTKPERISPGFSEINICCMKFNRIRNLDVHVWPYVTNHAEFTLQMHLFPPVYNPWYMFYLFSNKYWYVSFFQYFILLHVHHGLKLQCTGKKNHKHQCMTSQWYTGYKYSTQTLWKIWRYVHQHIQTSTSYAISHS